MTPAKRFHRHVVQLSGEISRGNPVVGVEMGFKPAVSLTEQIADHLSAEIISGRLAPTARIQECHIAAIHVICELVDAELFPE